MSGTLKYKILVVDDNPEILEDFKKVLGQNVVTHDALEKLSTQVFGERETNKPKNFLDKFELHFASQGADAIKKIEESITLNHPFSVMYIDVKMPPGMNGLETVKRVHLIDSNLEIVICSAYNDYTLDQMAQRICDHDRLIYIKKPFTSIEVQQLTRCLTSKWQAQRNSTNYIRDLEKLSQNKNQYLKILIESAIVINQSASLEDTIQATLRCICDNTSYCGAHAYLFEINRDINCKHIWHYNRNVDFETLVAATNDIEIIYPGEEVAGQILIEKNPILINKHENASLFARWDSSQNAKIESILGLPVCMGQNVVGVIELFSQLKEKEDAHLLKVLKETANLLSRSIEKDLSNNELKESREKALIAVKAKSEFLANMSHEIRTPLNSILGYTQILRRNHELTEKTKENYLSIIEKSGNHLLNIINSILDLSKIEAGNYSLKKEPFNLVQLLQEIKNMFYVKCEQKSIEFLLDISDSIPTMVSGDANRIKHVLINLANNAVKHTKVGAVTINSMYTDQKAIIEVHDTGSGISEDHLREIFKPFFQVELLEEREGTGLGLAIVKKDIEIMNGEIFVTSTLGKGTTFKLFIPLPKSLQENESTLQKDVVVQQLDTDQDWRVLVIDNEKTNRELLIDIFRLNGFKVDYCNYSEEAIAAANEMKPHFIFINLALSKYNQATIIRKILKLSPKTVLIGVSSDTIGTSKKLSKKLGCHDIIYKPFEINSLLMKLTNHFPIKYIMKEHVELDPSNEKKLVIDWDEVGRIVTPMQLDKLWDGFSRGDLNYLSDVANEMSRENPLLESFCNQLCLWADDFNDLEIGASIEKLEKTREKLNG